MYEEVVHGAAVIEASSGDVTASERLRDALGDRAGALRRPSADLVSMTPGEVRVIEVKTRGGGAAGALSVPERELATFRAGGDICWLYMVEEVTQPWPVRLTVLQDPGSLPWQPDQPAERGPDEYRGVRHEGTFVVDWKETLTKGVQVDLSGLDLPTWGGHSKD